MKPLTIPCLAAEPYCLPISFSEHQPQLHHNPVLTTPVKLSTPCNEFDRRNLEKRADKQAGENEKPSFPSFKPGDQVVIHRPYHETDGSNPKLNSPWHDPYSVRTQLSPVTYRVSNLRDPAEIIVYLGRMKKYNVPTSPPVPDLEALDVLCLGTTRS